MPIEDYYRDLRDVLKGQDERDPWPTGKDLNPTVTYIDRKSYLGAQALLKEHRYCLIEGAERRGKTTLARYIGLQHLEGEWYVARIDVGRVSDAADLRPLLDLLEGGVYDRSGNLFIIEDCHMGFEIAEKLLRSAERCREASFLFTASLVYR